MTTTIRTTGDLRDDMPKLGLRNFWWPAAQAKKIGTKPVAIKILGEELAFFRQAGKVYAFHDRCPHRGLPLSCGQVRYPGTLTCAYHGWTYDVNGKLIAALNEGPDSVLPGKVQLRTYPVEERAGIVWVYMGTGQPKPLEEDVPAEILASDTIVNTVVDEWPCSWLPTVQNLLDTHDIVVHPNSAYFYFRKLRVGNGPAPPTRKTARPSTCDSTRWVRSRVTIRGSDDGRRRSGGVSPVCPRQSRANIRSRNCACRRSCA